NVRTYVRYKGMPGVYFFSLDAASLPAVLVARAVFKLPYFHSVMLIRSDGESFEYTNRRLKQPRPANFQAKYWPTSAPRVREKDSLEYFLTERYCLYTFDQGQVRRAYIHHKPW